MSNIMTAFSIQLAAFLGWLCIKWQLRKMKDSKGGLPLEFLEFFVSLHRDRNEQKKKKEKKEVYLVDTTNSKEMTRNVP